VCFFVSCFIVNCEMNKKWAVQNFACYYSLAIFLTRCRKKSRWLSFAPFLARYRSLSLSLRGLTRCHQLFCNGGIPKNSPQQHSNSRTEWVSLAFCFGVYRKKASFWNMTLFNITTARRQDLSTTTEQSFNCVSH